MSSQFHNRIIVVTGLIFMFALLYYVFGTTHDGMYATATIKSVQLLPEIEEGSQEKAFAVEMEFLSGPYAGQTLPTEHFEAPGSIYNMDLKVGETVLAVAELQEDQLMTGVDEHYNSRKLMYISMALILMITAIAGVNGVKALLALFLTLIIIFGIMARLLLAGWSPVPLAIVSAIFISATNLAFIAGITRKGLIALIGTLSGVVLAGLFGWFAAVLLRLTGYTGHESTYLQILNATIDLRGLLISGIIIGALGAVMDVAISIASALLEISLANPGYDRKKLFASGMNIGRDIIGSMVNTLILAYTGASLTLILLFAMQKEDFPLIKIMNMEFICAEIVRSLAGLFGMVLAIPLTALAASIIYTRPGMSQCEPEENEEEESTLES